MQLYLEPFIENKYICPASEKEFKNELDHLHNCTLGYCKVKVGKVFK